MDFSRPLLSELRTRIAADVGRHSNGDPNVRGSLEFAMANALTGMAHGLYGFLDYQSKQLFDESADDESLLRRAAEFGIYRIAAKFATGSITVTGLDDTGIPKDREWTQNGFVYVADAEVIIAAGTAVVPVTAKVAGMDSNIASGTLQIMVPLAGIDSDATIIAPGIEAGAEIETIKRVRQRLEERKQNPPRGGNDNDWKAWCKQGHQDITRVWVRRNEDAAGATVYGVVTCYVVPDELPSPIPAQGVIDAATAYVDQPDVRPAGMKTFYILAPTGKTLNITFTSLTPNTLAVRAAIELELKDLLKREAVPGGKILLTHIRAAISRATGEEDYRTNLADDFVCASGELATLGVLTWPGA